MFRSRAPQTNPQPVPGFEGRPLDRPEEDLEDQGLRFDVDTLLSRRRVLGWAGAGAGLFALAACGADTSSTSTSTATSATAASTEEEFPEETAGPYPGDGSNGPDVLEDSGVVRRDITADIDGSGSADGVPMRLTMTLVDLAGGDVPFAGAAVYLWQCDAAGRYSLYSSGVEDRTYLRGVQVADDEGVVVFDSIVPGCYAGRWPHLHFEVFPTTQDATDPANAVLTSQVALPENVCTRVYTDSRYDGSAQNLSSLSLATDMVFADDAASGVQVATVTGSVAAGYSASISVPIDTSTQSTGGDGGGGGGGRPPGAPPTG